MARRPRQLVVDPPPPRRRPSPPRALAAAARRVKLDDRPAVKAAAAREGWQEEAWAYFDEVPELKFAVLYVANQLSKLRIYAAAYPPGAEPGTKPVPVDDPTANIPPALAASAKAELERLKSGTGGHAEFLSRLSINLDVPGECHVVGFAADALRGTEEEWLVVSTSELVEKSGKLAVRSSPDDRNPRPIDPDKDTAFRVWLKHGRWSGRADSHVRGVLSTCKTLTLLCRQLDAEAMSRLGAGILLAPTEIEGRAVEAEADGTEDPPEAGAGPSDDPFLDDLEDALVTPVDEPGSAEAVVPFVVRAPAEALKEFRHVTIARLSDQYLDARIDRQVNRLARGVFVPVEIVTGHMSTTYANAEQIDADVWEKYLETRATNMVEAVSFGFLRPNLLETFPAAALDIGRIVTWYDESNLVEPPDLSASANDGIDRGLISDEAWRGAFGWPETAAPLEDPTKALDAGPVSDPDVEAAKAIGELAQKVYLAVGVLMTAEEGRALLNRAGAGLAGPAPTAPAAPAPAALPPAPPPPPAEPTVPPAVAASAIVTTGRLKRDHGARLVAIDRELRTRILTAANDAMGRALERAGNRLKSKSSTDKATLARVRTDEVAATLGATKVLALCASGNVEELFADEWAELERQYLEWGATAQRDALEVAGQVAGKWNIAQRAELQLRQARNLKEGWGWLKEGLTSLAGDRLFDPHPAAPPLGEHDPLLRVPPGMVRQSISIAGGSPLGTTDGKAAFVTVGQANGNIGGIGTGKLLGDAMTDAGAKVEGYRWVYGPALRQRPFHPHVELDGKVFRHFDDPVLANHHGFPPVSHFIPGDHDGCICDAEPILLTAEEAAATGFTTPTVEAEPDGLPLGAEAQPAPINPDPPIVRPDPQTARETAAAKHGVTVAELETARKRLPEFRKWVRDHARVVQADAQATLARADVAHLNRPLRSELDRAAGKRGKLGGEWDWLEGITDAERKRLRRNFKDGGGYEPDNVAQRLREAGLVDDENLADSEIIREVWLPLDRQREAAGALARGKLPSDAYGDLNIDDLVPAVKDEGYSLTSILDPDELEGAGHLAATFKDQAYTEARRSLGSYSLNPIHGPAPWRMTESAFAEEVLELEHLVENGLEGAATAQLRLRELIPYDLDRGQSLTALYDEIVATASLADESVAEWIEVY